MVIISNGLATTICSWQGARTPGRGGGVTCLDLRVWERERGALDASGGGHRDLPRATIQPSLRFRVLARHRVSTVTPVAVVPARDSRGADADGKTLADELKADDRILADVRLVRVLERGDGWTVYLADNEKRHEIVLLVVAASEEALARCLCGSSRGTVVRRTTLESSYVAEVMISEHIFSRFQEPLMALQRPPQEGTENPTLASPSGPVQARLANGAMFAKRYRIDHLFGRGGMGEVYRAYDDTLQRSVALKILGVDSSGCGTTDHREESKRRLLREARVVSSLKHPHIVEIYDFGESAGLPYLVLELCEGGSLRKVMAAGASRADRLRWLREIAEGLAHAHDQGIVHRDTKPENVLLMRDGVAKVADFGIAKALNHDQSGNKSLFEIIGTPRYMAPEQRLGGVIDARVDQYAWSLVAYELLTNSLPPWSTIHGLRSPRLAASAPAVPTHLRRVLERAMASDPEERYANMRELIADLSPPRRRLRRSVIPVVAVAALGAAAAGGFRVIERTTVMAPSVASTKARPLFDAEKVDAEMVSRCAPAARSAFTVALQLWRDAAQWEAVPKFDEATKSDPECAPASLYYLIAATHTFPRRREQFRLARDRRAKLNERERRLLEALEPTVADRHDFDEELRRAGALAEQMPVDPDAQRIYGRALYRVDKLDEALAVVDRFAALYPNPIPGNEYLAATIQIARGDTAAALERFGRCLQIAPDSGDCLLWKGRFLAAQGKCGEAESTFRHLTSVVPESEPAHFNLANVLLISTHDPSAARGVFEERWRYLSPNSYGPDLNPELARLADEYRMAIVGGDLERALPLVRKWSEGTRSSNNARFRGEPLVELIELLRELGYAQEARDLSREGLREQHSWTADDVFDAKIELARSSYLTGVIDAARFRELRDEWIALHPHLTLAERWFGGFAGLPIVGADMDPPVAVGQYVADWSMMTPEAFARAATELLRAGRVSDAVQHAEAAAKSCSVFSARGYFHAQIALAKAHDAAHDVAYACKQYGALQDALAKSHRSSTLRFATTRMKELSCQEHTTPPR